MTTGDAIKYLRESHGMTQPELAQKIGVSKQAVSTWEANIKLPRMGAIQAIADLFGMKKSDIIEGKVSSFPNSVPVMSFERIPIIGTVRAGFGGVAYEEFGGYDYSDVKNPKEYIFLRVYGDSMSPQINAGELALVQEAGGSNPLTQTNRKNPRRCWKPSKYGGFAMPR